MNQLPSAPGGGDYRSIIERAAQDPTFDLDKLQRLLDMQEAHDQRMATQAFAQAHTAAEAEMETIRADANNPQTRSRYATFAQLDREARPIYTKHGFNISFTTEPMGTPDSLLVVGTLSHRLGHSKRFQIPVPIVTVGIKGAQMMTPIHATMSAISYGKRNLEILMFNLAIGEDDDGNRAGSRREPPSPPASRPKPEPKPFELIDPVTGEVVTAPIAISFGANDDWRSWGERFIGAIRNLATSLEEVDQWVALNHDQLAEMEKAKPALFKTLCDGIGAIKDGYHQ